MGNQLRAPIVFALLILICHKNVTTRRLGQSFDSSMQDTSSLSSLLASHPTQPDLSRTTAHVRPTSAQPTIARPPQDNSPRNLTHRGRATVAALNIQAAHNSSRIVAASSQQHSSIVASASPQAGTLPAARAKWRQMELAFAGAHSAASLELKRTLDELWLVLGQQDKLISSACKQSLDELVIGLGEQELWASQMVDASAGHRRLPSGLLEGTLTELGNFDECLAISHSGGNRGRGKPLRGQYCSVLIKPPLANRPRLHTICRRLPSLSASAQIPGTGNSSALRLLAQHSHQFYYAGLRLGLCLPSRCSQTDVHHLLQAYLIKYELVGQVKHCQREPAEERLANTTTTKSLLLDNPLVPAILQNFDLTQQCILFTFLCLTILSALGTWLDRGGKHERRATTIMSGIMRNNQPSQSTSGVIASHSNEPCSLASKRARQYRVCHGSNSTSCCSGDQATGSSDDDLVRERSGERGTHRLGLQKNPLAELATTQIALDIGEPLSGGVPGRGRQPVRAARVAGNKSATRMETLPLFLEREQEQLIGAVSSSSRSHLRDLLVCFSLGRNIRSIGKLTADNHQRQTADGESGRDLASSMTDLKVVHGMRTLSMIWIIFGHTVGLVSPEMMNNLFPLASLSCASRFLQAILNTTLAVDTFFMISGLVTVISFVRKCKSASDLIDPPSPVVVPSATIWPHTLVAAPDAGEDIEVSSVDSSNSAITSVSSSASSNRCIGLASKSSSQKNFIVNKALRVREPPDCRRSLLPKDGGWPSDFQPLVWMLLRYLRLTPAYASVIGLSILMPSLGSGPFWPETVGQLGSTCRANWWTNLFYVNNFIETDKLCLIHSWYLSNDWQFFLLALILFGVFYKSRKLSLILLVSAFVASSVTTFIVTTEHDYPPTIVTTSPAIAERWEFIHSLYYKPWPHLPAYLIGLIVGYAILKFQYSSRRQRRHHQQLCVGSLSLSGQSSSSKLDLAPGSRLLCWLMFGLISFAVLNSIYPWNMGLPVDPILTGLHAATFRTLWAICCAWLVFALVTRPRNPLGLLLSWRGFQVTSRLTYCAYLVHPLVIYYHFGTIRERIDSSIYGQLHRFLATLIMSYLLAFVMSLMIESPSVQVQKFLITVFKDTEHDDDEHDKVRHLQNSNETHLVEDKQVAQSDEEQKSSLGRNIIQPDYYNSESLTGYTRANDGSYRSDLCKSILFAPSARSRANLSIKSIGEEQASSTAAPNLVPDNCQHTQLAIADMIRRYPTMRDTHELSDGGGSSNGSNQSGIDEEFQKKLAHAIGRGFKLRSRIVNGTVKQQKPEAGATARQEVTQVESPIRAWAFEMASECTGRMVDDSGHGSEKQPKLHLEKPLLTMDRHDSTLGTFLGPNKKGPRA